MIDVRRLRALRELADRGTIAAAADALHLTASAVSQQLAALEAEVGQPLIERHGRGVRLTAAADVVLRHADAMLVEVERLEAGLGALRAGLGGRVRIGSFATGIGGLVVPILDDPAVVEAGLELELLDVEAPESYRLLTTHELDVVVSMQSPHAPRGDDPRILRTELLADVVDVALRDDHPLADAPSVALADLARDTWVAPPVGWSCEHVVLAGCASAGFAPAIQHRVSEWAVALELVAATGAAAFVPRLAGVTPPDRVVVRELEGEAPARHLFAACRRGGETNPAVAVVLGALARAAERRVGATAAIAG